MEEDHLKGLTVMVSDITAEVEREKLEADTREMITMFEAISRDRNGFLEFYQETESIIESMREDREHDMTLMKRRLHTVKGNSAIFGLQRMATTCHEIEDYIEQSGDYPEEAHWTSLFSCWQITKGNLRRLVDDDNSEHRLSDRQYNALLQSLLDREPLEVIAVRVATWRLESTELRMERVAEQAKRLAEKLGKGEIEVDICHNDLRTESAGWSEFWAVLTHVVRNSVDHGLETPQDRRAAGKAGPGQLKLETVCDGDQFIISIADDGRGIDWEKVREKALQAGLPAKTEKDLCGALFADGVSTADSVTETSGRGVGMAAVKESVHKMGGKIKIRSIKGTGTEMRFIFPIETMAPETDALLHSHGIDSSASHWSVV